MTPTPAQQKLIGSVTVTPSTVRPGEPFLVQVLDPQGKPYTAGSGVKITINGVETASRYCQFPQPGTRGIAVRAVQGNVRDIATASVQITGAPLIFRLTTAAPALTAMPILQVEQDFANPYTASFSLANSSSVKRVMARSISLQAPANSVAAAAAAAKPAVSTPLASVPTLRDEVSRLSVDKAATPTLLATANGTQVRIVSQQALNSAPPQITPPAGIGYRWDFGDGTSATTTSPNIIHNYFPAIKADLIAHSFDVKCTIVHDNLTVTRTLVLHSAYGMCRRSGVAVPYVTGDSYATFQKVAFSASMIVHNPEPEASITLDQMAVVPVSADSTAVLPAPKFTKMGTPVTINANSSNGIGVYVTKSQLGSLGHNVSGFTVYYSGTLNSRIADSVQNLRLVSGGAANLRPGVPVKFSWHFRIRLSDSGASQNQKLTDRLHEGSFHEAASAAAAASTPVVRVGQITVDSATKTVSIPITGAVHSAMAKSIVSSAMQTGARSAAAEAPNSAPRASGSAAGQVTPRPAAPDPPPPPPAAGPVQAGNYCDPDNISDADQATAASLHVACLPTTDTEERTVPGSYQNAQMGDVILSPGGDSPISVLLRGLGQNYAHSGIMSQNFTEITHCTAAEKRYADYPAGVEGTGGIQPDVLQYGWPGSITQTVDNAIIGQDILDPNGKTYTISGFNSAPSPEFALIPPLVIKPLPENEEAARPILRKAATLARSKGAQLVAAQNNTSTLIYQKGACYYSFYGYTKPEVGAGFGDPAPAEAGWAQGMTPGVCSAFVWLSMKANGAPLMGPGQFTTDAEISSDNAVKGAEAIATTLDGLFYYPEAERQQGAQSLNTIFRNMVMDQEGVFKYLPFVSSAIASAIADQIINVFAFGDPNMGGSDQWKNPGDANAVSPDNISWWNPPLFGYSEPVQYLQTHTEMYTSSKWTPYATTATISGVVTLNGTPVSGAEVQISDGHSAVTPANGQYTLTGVPIASQTADSITSVIVKASVTQDGKFYSNGLNGQLVSLSPTVPKVTANIALTTNSAAFRDVVVVCQMISCDHGDGNPTNTHGTKGGPKDTYHIFLGPGQLNSGCSYSFDYDGGGYFTVSYDFNAQVSLDDFSVSVGVIATITDDGSKQAQNTVNHSFKIPRDSWISEDIDNFEASGTGYHNGPANFTFTIANNQETT